MSPVAGWRGYGGQGKGLSHRHVLRTISQRSPVTIGSGESARTWPDRNGIGRLARPSTALATGEHEHLPGLGPSRLAPLPNADGGSGSSAVRRIRRGLIMLVASLAVFAACAVMVADGRVGPTERAVFHAINGLPGWLYRPMLVAQYLGVLGAPLVIAAGALAWRRWRLAIALALVVPIKLAAEKVPKQLVQRERQVPACPTRSCVGCRTAA
jgi:hypothetical protein